MALHMIAKIR